MANITFTEGSGLNDSIYGKSQAPIRMMMTKRGEAFEAQSALPELFAMGNSNKWAEKYTTMTAMEGFQPVTENAAYPTDGMQEGYSRTIEHTEWKNSFAISRKMIDDANIVDLRQKPEAFIAGWYRAREKFGAQLYGEAIKGNSSFKLKGMQFSTKAADGQCVFSTAHPSILKASRTQSNLFSDAFSNDALMAMESAMNDFRGDADEVLDVSPSVIVIPNDYALKKTVFAAIGADKDPATANNGFNYNFGRWTVVVWQYLNQFITSGTAPWMLIDKEYNDIYGGAPWLDRVKLEVKSEIAANDANVWKGYGRFGAGFNDWRYVAVGGVSGGTDLISA